MGQNKEGGIYKSERISTTQITPTRWNRTTDLLRSNRSEACPQRQPGSGRRPRRDKRKIYIYVYLYSSFGLLALLSQIYKLSGTNQPKEKVFKGIKYSRGYTLRSEVRFSAVGVSLPVPEAPICSAALERRST